MQKHQHRLDRYWLCLGLAALIGVFAIIHPELLLLIKSPMSGDPWTIKDPTVSWMAFMPSLREFRFELFEHANVLWSNLRGLGQPMLGNGVQAASLFPLTLIFIGLPDQLFWSVMPIVRVCLIALACFVLAHRVFGLSFAASIAFAILAGLNLNVVRWINHPWANGMLAGLWYLVFLHRVAFVVAQSSYSRRLSFLGLIIAVYSMVTCGFPEAAAAAAMLVLVIFTCLVLANWQAVTKNWRSMVRDILLCHAAGFGFSALQIFALFEYIDFTGVMSLRDSYIDATFRADEALPYWLSQFTLLWESDSQHRYLNFSIGLLGLVLACKGVSSWIMHYSSWSATIRTVGWGFLFLMLLFVAKAFGLFAPLAWLFAHTPVLAQSHFPLYFSPLFYFGLAFFAAIGMASCAGLQITHRWQRIGDLLVTAAAILLSIRLLEMSVAHFNGINRQNFWIMQNRGDGADFIWLFLVLSALLLLWQLMNFSDKFRRLVVARSAIISSVVSVLLISGLIYESAGTQRNRYANSDSASLFIPEAARKAVQQTIQDLPVARHELRNNDHSGRFIELGIATIDNGISAMLPPNTRRVRRALYHTEYGGYYPLKQEKVSGAGAIVSNNLQILPPQPLAVPDWTGFQRSGSSDVQFQAWDRAIEQMRDNPLVLNGIIRAPLTSTGQPIWVEIKEGRRSFWLKANQVINTEQNESGLMALQWSVDMPVHWLSNTHFQFIVRLVNHSSATYLDSEQYSVVVHKSYPYAQPSRSLPASERLAHSPSANQSASEWRVNFDPSALPRAFIASRCEMFADETQVSSFLAQTSQILTGQIALLNSSQDNANSLPNSFCDTYLAPFKKVGIINDQGSWLQLSSVSGPGLLYLNDTFYPGWKAHDRNTQETLDIQPANLGMRTVYLSEQRDYDIEFRYQPGWLYWVYFLFLLASLVTLYMMVLVPTKSEENA